MKVDLGTHLRDNQGHLFLWDLELFWCLFEVGQTNIENMQFSQLSHYWDLNVDLGTHLSDKHGHQFLWDLDIFLALDQGCSNQGWKYAHFFKFSKLSCESGFRYPFER